MHPSSRPLSLGLLTVGALLAMLAGCADTNVTTVGASQVSISPPSTSVKVGDTTRLSARVLSSDGVPLSGRTIQWTSLDANARVDATGLVFGLAVGLARIQASSEGASGTAQVSVTSGPAIRATPATVEFSGIRNGSNPGDRVVALTNSGDGTLNGLAVSVSYAPGGPTGWLSTTLASNTAPATLVLGATLDGLAVGTYGATVTVTSPVASNNPITVPVQLQVQAPAPVMALSATSVAFSAIQGSGNPATQSVTVSNVGGGTLAGLGVSVSYGAGQPSGWLTAALGATTAPTGITFTAATGSLSPGSYSATVRVTSTNAQNSPQDVVVSFTVGAVPPAIGAQPGSITIVGTTPATRQVQLTNVGGGTLTGFLVSPVYSAGQPTGWLTTSLSSTSAPSTLTVSVNPGSLPPGIYSAVARITAAGAANSPLDLPVQLQVPTPAPAIALAANAAGFNAVQGGGNPAPQTVGVTNAGGGTLSGLATTVSYGSGQPTGWLNASLGATTAPTSITLTAATGSLPAGSYNATVQVASGVAQNSPQTIAVTFTVTAPPPAIGAQPTTLTFSGVSPANQPVQITNTGGGTLSGLNVSMVYPSGQPSGWLTTSLSGTTAPATLTVGVNSASLAPGTYNATVQITAAGAANSPVNVPVQLTVPPPAIALATKIVGFGATQGGGNPAPQAVAITNAGGSTLTGLGASITYAAGQSTGWLNATLGATTAPTSVTLTATIGALQAGTYNATVRIASAVASNSPQDIAVTFTVGAGPPIIGALPAGLSFTGVTPANQPIQITNTGGGTLSGLSVTAVYPGGGPTGWLTASLSGTAAPATITVGADGSALAPGSYTATLRIDAPGAANTPLDVPVQLTVPAPAPAIALGSGSAGFNAAEGGASPAAQVVTVTNAGGGTLSGLAATVSYAPSQPAGWLSAALGATTAPTDITLSAATGSLVAGTYSATVQVTSAVASNSPQNITVTFTVSAPSPSIAPGSNTAGFNAVEGGANPAAQTVTVTNSGGGTLSGLSATVSYASGQPTGWLNAALGATTAPTDVTLSATTGSLTAGTYNATVQVASATASNSPQSIAVTFTVTAAPASILLSSSSATFNATEGGGNPATQAVTVTNSGGGTLSGLGVSVSYASGQPTGWLNAALGATTAPTDVTLSATTGSLTPGTYNATVQVASASASNSPQSIAVTFTVTAAPASIALGSSSATFNATEGGSSPATQAVTVTNAGGGTLSGLSASVSYSGSATGWLNAALGATTAPTDVTLTATTGSLPAGTYNATVQIASAGATNSPQSIAVTFTVTAAAPAIGAQPTSLTFNGATPPSQQVQLTNTGGGTLSGIAESMTYGAGQPTGWLTTSLGGTTAPATLTVTAAAGTLAAGTYTATVQISAAGASNSPLDIAVSYTVPASSPSSPTSLSAASVSSSSIDLGWAHDGLLVTYFELERAPGSAPGSFQPLDTVPATGRGYTDSGLTPATMYVYRVRACTPSICSAWSNTAAATTQDPAPATPTGLTATATSSTQVSVTWNAVAGATTYEVRRHTPGGGAPLPFTVAAPTTAFADTGLSAGTAYNYDVRACNASGCSAFSAVASATTP